MNWNSGIRVLGVLAALVFMQTSIAQDHEQSNDLEEENVLEHHHQLGIVLGHAHISQGVKGGKEQWQILPSFGLNYNYWFNERLSLGIHTDIIIETYEVQRHLDNGDAEVLERVTPVAPALMVGYKPHEHFGFLLGPGYEFEPDENLLLFRVETEYSIEMASHLEFEAGLGYDFRVNAFDSWSLILGIARSF